MDLAPFMADSSGDTERSGQIRAGRSESRSRAGEAGTNRGRVASGGPRGWGGTAPWLAFALSDLIRGQMLDSAVWATEGPEEQGQAESAAVRTRGVRGRCLGPTAAGRRVRGGRIRWPDAEVAVQVGAERVWNWPGAPD